MSTPFSIRPLIVEDQPWITELMLKHWGSDLIVVHDTIYQPSILPGFIAILKNKPVGLITYHIHDEDCEIISLNSLDESCGIGTALIDSVKQIAQQAHCQRIWLITTNDNINALRFYQKRGFTLVAVYRNAVERSRKLKPQIPLIGNDGIPIRDEIELELILTD